MPTAAGEPAGVLAGAGGVPLVVSLGSIHAQDPEAVGDTACLLAAARSVGMPVANGVVVTAAGIGADDPLPALHHAWLHMRGLVRIVLTDCGTSPGTGSSSALCDASTWMGLLNGVYDVLAYDIRENPGRRSSRWAILLLRVPSDAHSVLVEIGPGERLVTWSSHGQPLVGRERRQVRRLAWRMAGWLGRPLSMELMTSGRGDWSIVDVRFPVPVSPADCP